MNAPCPLSVLDLSPVSHGSDAAAALRNSIDLARRAEALGYARCWVAEHHFVGVASAAPAVLVAHIAAATSTIRVGSAAVQLGFTTAPAVVEAFGTIAALHPGRIDLGLGRSGQRRAEAERAAKRPAEPGPPRETIVRDGVVIPPPFDASRVVLSPRHSAAAAVLQQPGARAPDFDDQVTDILALLDGTYRTEDDIALHVSPGEGTPLDVWVFGSSAGPSAALAGRLGLPFGANYHVSPATTLDAVAAYRDAFVPGVLREPYVVVSADAVIAPTDAEAVHLASTFGHWTHSIRSGHGAIPYPDPEATPPLDADARALVDDRIVTQFVGSPATVVEGLDDLRALTDADELVVTGITHRHDDRVRSYALLAHEWGIAGSVAA